MVWVAARIALETGVVDDGFLEIGFGEGVGDGDNRGVGEQGRYGAGPGGCGGWLGSGSHGGVVGGPDGASDQDGADVGIEELGDCLGGGDPIRGDGELVLQFVKPNDGVGGDAVEQELGKPAVVVRGCDRPCGQGVQDSFVEAAGLACA